MVELIPGKVALVTGSTRGMGRAIARRLALAGADVMIHDVDPAQASRFGEAAGPEAVIAEIEGLGRRCAVTYGDLTRREHADQIMADTLAQFGRLDILVNNAGGDIGASGNKPVPNDCVEIPDEDIDVLIDRNLRSVMNMSRAVAKHMMERGDGSIVSISSLAGMQSVPLGAVYAVAKAGVIHWTRCLSAQLRPYGVNVNCVAPGEMKTARFLATRHVPEERLSEQGRLTRLGDPDDVAKAVLFFASDLAAFISGQTIVVNGGSFQGTA